MTWKHRLLTLIDFFIPNSILNKGENIGKHRLFITILLLAFVFILIGDFLVYNSTLILSRSHLYISYAYPIVGLLLLWLSKNLTIAVNTVIFMIIVNTTMIALNLVGIYTNVLIWLSILPVIALVTIGPKTAVAWTLVLIFNFILIFYLPASEPNKNSVFFGKQEYLFNLINLCIAFVTIMLLFWKNQKDLLVKIKKQDKILNSRKFAELELQALQSQMNPHFIFNSLQAIQDFVAGKDEKTANKYMSNFSKLMRLFLESSKERYISLEEELELLQLYIELEQLRFEPPFDFDIDCPESIDSGGIELPSMLLQPFVENAINHGLKYKKGQGLLQITIREQEQVLFIQIIDNGVGVKKAREIKKQASHSYQSRSMGIIEERLKTIQFVDNIQIDIQTKDRLVEGRVEGTIVEIVCPLVDD